MGADNGIDDGPATGDSSMAERNAVKLDWSMEEQGSVAGTSSVGEESRGSSWITGEGPVEMD